MDSNTNDIPLSLKIIRLPEVVARVGLSPGEIDILERTERFPRRVPLTARAIGWRCSADVLPSWRGWPRMSSLVEFRRLPL